MRVRHLGFIGGWRGTARTVREMRRLVDDGKKHPTVIWLAGRLASKRHKDDYLGQTKELFKFVKRYVHYVRDPRGVELLRSPFWTLYYRSGDCDCQAVLYCALAQGIGFNTRFKTVKADPTNPTEFSHVYSQVLVPGKGWLSADTIVPRARLGWETDKQFGSQVWEGGVTMSGDVKGLGSERPLADFLKGALTNALGTARDSLMGSAAGAVDKLLGTSKPPPAPPSAIPGWLLPLGIVGAAGLGAFLVFRRKRAS